MNKADNQAGSQAIDSLINYETVKVCMAYYMECLARRRESCHNYAIVFQPFDLLEWRASNFSLQYHPLRSRGKEVITD